MRPDWFGLSPFVNGMDLPFTPGVRTAPPADDSTSTLSASKEDGVLDVFSVEHLEACAKEAVRQEFLNMSSSIPTSMATVSPPATAVSSSGSKNNASETPSTDASAAGEPPLSPGDHCVPQNCDAKSSTSAPAGDAAQVVPPGCVAFMMMPAPYMAWPMPAQAARLSGRKIIGPETDAQKKERLEGEKQELVRLFKKKTREAALVRFRQKRRERRYGKHIRYDCRKKLADSRPRVKGRFVRAKEEEKDQVVPRMD